MRLERMQNVTPHYAQSMLILCTAILRRGVIQFLMQSTILKTSRCTTTRAHHAQLVQTTRLQ